MGQVLRLGAFRCRAAGFYSQKGYESVLWTADDANDDQLEFAIYFRGENETTWKLLKDKLDSRFYSWDTTTMPDGAYYLKVVASDAPSNPAGEGAFLGARIRPLRGGQHAALNRSAHGGTPAPGCACDFRPALR
jgi:hypothetical protein